MAILPIAGMALQPQELTLYAMHFSRNGFNLASPRSLSMDQAAGHLQRAHALDCSFQACG